MTHDQMNIQLMHEAAMRAPNSIERPLVEMVRCLASLVVDYGRDPVFRVEVASILVGLDHLLDADWGTRLDTESIREMLFVCAETMDFDLLGERFRDDGVER